MENSFPIFSTAVLLFFILDPFGNVPLLLSMLKNIDNTNSANIVIKYYAGKSS
ncbi:hypothetical protein CW745_09850 [Psychromonas sp. psych-6C06]|uniref:MarC family protein n=1 Tax=Psychromonas sp. psych-6C06 TaxID=2058089 RepID=UPI000C32CECF|nr:MarC family protein [Psychromonas sp. psych-6C06]PKF61618.1 hypothetical protein CW745_09850 [Psychromonas sp. psych-6C06]